MAEFCQQCADEDGLYNGLAGLCDPEYVQSVICEGCGFIYVNERGECMGRHPRWPEDPEYAGYCLKSHPSLWPLDTAPEKV